MLLTCNLLSILATAPVAGSIPGAPVKVKSQSPDASGIRAIAPKLRQESVRMI